MQTQSALFEPLGIDHVGIRYRDLRPVVVWFRDTLRLRIDYEARAMALVDIGGGAQLALFQAEGDEPLRQPHHVALRVADVAAAEAALRAAGIQLERFGPNWGFQDPEGNIFHFMPSRERTAAKPARPGRTVGRRRSGAAAHA
jgi:catechol 2,3-dioxygenase-like lactoylglutathione lyase family enzyme